MKMSCRKKIALDSRKDAIVIPIYKNIGSLRHITGKKIDDELRTILDSDYFNYEENEIRSFYVELGKKLKKIYLINTPKEIEYAEVYRTLGATIVDILNHDQIDSISLIAFEDIYNEKKNFSCTSAFIEGILFGMYSFDMYQTKKSNKSLAEVEIITNITKLKTYFDNSFSEWEAVFGCLCEAKDLGNMPANELTPEKFAAIVKDKAHANVKVEILDEAQLIKEGFNLIHAVGRGSSNKPYFAKLSYAGAPMSKQNVALVGKGVTFDSGGTNLKPSGAMETMKSDMCGAADVFAITNLIASQELPINVNTYMPLVENIIGGDAIRPGDIIKSYSGKTVEILNTDAEGRLILADALAVAASSDPEIIIDMATLTGACIVALGDFCAGIFSNRKFLSKQISDIASKIGEDIWELPLYEGYAAQIKSKNADLQNMGTAGRSGGSIMAALFLKEFVDNYPWIHLDIAGPAFLEKKHPVFGDKATGFGVRLVYYFLKSHYLVKDES